MWTSDEAQTFADYLCKEDSAARWRIATEVLAAGDRIRDAREGLATQVAETSIGHLKGFLPKGICADLDLFLRERTTIVTERVEAAEGKWQIDLIDNEYLPLAETAAKDPFSALCLAPGFIAGIAEIASFAENTITTRRWVNRYGAGDSIAPHDDTTGDYQIMICVAAPPAEYGGALVFEDGTEADLQQGDLLVMKHAELVHWTTPLAADTPGERATATCRYYVEGGRLPRSRVLAHSVAGPKTATRQDLM
ncbi:2OG-Fe(II) oxygenase [Streptomyces sp. MUM 178J]|uniref:2OG-Fe(II) oxygenase n=1 Tax=Streptomyces sp. MUM 178J TaxID=2791991 RepID=UPI001F04AB0F|nr:2OG-Fe(II) oxygenase [Streptomyces sp. MUM 178J]WRQ80744.1 2OG-Fe(II) oxygenase [Streptomyces sp. MUM 178J]